MMKWSQPLDFADEKIHIIPSKKCNGQGRCKTADEDEFVEILWMPLEEVMQKINWRNCGCERRLLHSMLGCIKGE